VNFSQGAAVRYRFGFTKLGASALISHLDVLRALPRSFRRAKIPLYYSTGFHPKPDFVFAPALSLGVSSTCEVADVKLTCELDPTSVLEALTAASAEGLTFFAGLRLRPTDRAVSRLVDTARYAIAIAAVDVDRLGGRAWLLTRIENAMAAHELPLTRTVDGVAKAINVREFLRAIDVDTAEARAAAARTGVPDTSLVLAVDVEIRGSGAVKVSEVVEALTETALLPHRAVRFALGAWDNGSIVSPLTLGDRP
jgi:radical SAM-linked protein